LAALGVLGAIYPIVQAVVERVAATPLKEIEKKYAQAELLADRAKKAASDAAGAADQATTQAAQATTQVSSLTKGVQDLRDRATGVEKQFGLVGDQIAEANNTAARRQTDFKATQDRLAKLEALVKNIGAENEASRNAYAEYKKEIDKVTAETARQQKRFAENSQYAVIIASSPEQRPLAEKVQNELAVMGFKASLMGLPTTAPPAGLPGPSWGPSTDPGNTLTYPPDSEMKAQEILAVIKHIIKDVRLRSAEPPKIPPPPGQTATASPPPAYRFPFFLTLRS
jgi:predicted phage tail protein